MKRLFEKIFQKNRLEESKIDYAVITVRRIEKPLSFKWAIDEIKGTSKKIGVKSGKANTPEAAFKKAYRVAKKEYGWE